VKVLLVEDDRATRLRVRAFVEEWGHHPVSVGDGAEAWERFQSEPFDCVLSDWMMPRVDGLELIRRIRQAKQDRYVYVILFTSQTDKANLVEGMEAGADDFLTKPFDKDELRVRLRAGQRIVELERRLAERNQELSMFSSVASHDLREPLRTISSFLTLFEKKYRGHLDQEAEEYLNFIMDGASRMRSLINDLLAYARLDAQASIFETVDLNVLVEEKLAAMGRAIEESEAKIVCDSLPQVEGDRTQLGQLLQNLISNAIKYRGDASPIIRISSEACGDAWRTSIEDNGIGIPEEHRQVIFEPFRRLHGSGSRYSGSGVGLSICQRVIARHGGQMEVTAADNGGSIFSFTLPASPSAENAAPPQV
jgi:signal transduction histidine kinase